MSTGRTPQETAYFGDIHNHSNISYAHGNIEDAVENAKQRLDFCSVTGHAHWTDMPEPNERIAHIVRFHEDGFEKLKRTWPHALEVLRRAAEPGRFITFPGFEVHSSRAGDRAVVYQQDSGELLYPESIEELQQNLVEMSRNGARSAIALPHHIGYHQGARGLNWDAFDPEASPVVEIYSMHGCAETTDGPLPFLHSMGPADWKSTMQYGLEQGHIFGFAANTDHHSAHPGSYGHGMTGVWAEELSREGIWEAYRRRRTFALTGDRMRVDFALGDARMGSVRAPGRPSGLELWVEGGDAIDAVDVLHNNELVRRVSPPEARERLRGGARAASGAGTASGDSRGWQRTKLYLELGWGPRGKAAPWEVDFGISEGEILEVEPRFRGLDVLSPEQAASPAENTFYSWCEQRDRHSVHFETITYGNPTTTTSGTQGVCLDVRMPEDASVWATLNGVEARTSLERLRRGGKSGHLRHEIDSPAWLFHRAPLEWEFHWDLTLRDFTPELSPGDTVYVRVRQRNNQWAWASPVFVR